MQLRSCGEKHDLSWPASSAGPCSPRPQHIMSQHHNISCRINLNIRPGTDAHICIHAATVCTLCVRVLLLWFTFRVQRVWGAMRPEQQGPGGGVGRVDVRQNNKLSSGLVCTKPAALGGNSWKTSFFPKCTQKHASHMFCTKCKFYENRRQSAGIISPTWNSMYSMWC